MIKELQITNFRSLKGTNRLEFASETQTTEITAPNATGKTSLFSSIYWCFYGVLPENVYCGTSPLLNIEVAEEMEEGSTSQVSVIVSVQIDDHTFSLCRSVEYVKRAGIVEKGCEYTYYNQSPNDRLFSETVNSFFPHEYSSLFFWLDDSFGKTGNRHRMEQLFTKKEINTIIGLANQYFSEIYFRPGQYELIYDKTPMLKENNVGYCELSQEDCIVLKLSLLLAACTTARNKQPNISFPIMIDSIFSCASIKRMKKAIELLFNSQFQVILTNNHVLCDNKDDGFHAQTIKAYEIKRNSDYSASIMVRNPLNNEEVD